MGESQRRHKDCHQSCRIKVFEMFFEICYLNEKEVRNLGNICLEADGVDFIRTSTGFGPEVATVNL